MTILSDGISMRYTPKICVYWTGDFSLQISHYVSNTNHFGCVSVGQSTRTRVRIRVSIWSWLELALPKTSTLLFVIIIDVITEEIDDGTPWAMLFADDLVLCDPDRVMMELRLERWRECMEKKSLKERKPNTYKQQGTLIRLGWRDTWWQQWSTCQQSSPTNILDQQ